MICLHGYDVLKSLRLQPTVALPQIFFLNHYYFWSDYIKHKQRQVQRLFSSGQLNSRDNSSKSQTESEHVPTHAARWAHAIASAPNRQQEQVTGLEPHEEQAEWAAALGRDEARNVWKHTDQCENQYKQYVGLILRDHYRLHRWICVVNRNNGHEYGADARFPDYLKSKSVCVVISMALWGPGYICNRQREDTSSKWGRSGHSSLFFRTLSLNF